MFDKLIHEALLKINPETAHEAALFLLKSKIAMSFISKPASKPVCLPQLPGLQFASRLGLAAGFDKNAEVFPALGKLGFGFLEVGTVTPQPQEGNPKPRLWRTPNESLVNQMGFNNCGVIQLSKHLKMPSSVPLFANIGMNKTTPVERAKEDYEILLTQLADFVDGFVINVSSPNTPGLRSLQDEEFLESLLPLLPNKPVFVKLAPDLFDNKLESLFKFIRFQRAFSGVVVTNTSKALAVSVANKNEGGLSGAPLFSRALECVALARKILGDEKVIIGVGGVNSLSRAQEMRSAGADLVEIYSAFIYRGFGLVREIAEGLA